MKYPVLLVFKRKKEGKFLGTEKPFSLDTDLSFVKTIQKAQEELANLNNPPCFTREEVLVKLKQETEKADNWLFISKSMTKPQEVKPEKPTPTTPTKEEEDQQSDDMKSDTDKPQSSKKKSYKKRKA